MSIHPLAEPSAEQLLELCLQDDRLVLPGKRIRREGEDLSSGQSQPNLSLPQFVSESQQLRADLLSVRVGPLPHFEDGLAVTIPRRSEEDRNQQAENSRPASHFLS